MMNRRSFIKNAGLMYAGLYFSAETLAAVGQNKLKIPQLLDSRALNHKIKINLQDGITEFFTGNPSKTRGFNGSYLGPVVRFYRGENTKMSFVNRLNEATTVHGHGLHVSGDIDGGPQLAIQPGKSWDFVLPIRQEASTNWFHPHLVHKTAKHVHQGLAGLYYIEDDNSQSLPLPKEYGVDDIPIIVQDREFSGGIMQPYNP